MKICGITAGCQPVGKSRQKKLYKDKSKMLGENKIPNYSRQFRSIFSFKGYPVYIVDGGAHADNMKHFATAISKDIEASVVNVDVISDNSSVKKLKSLEEQLIELNKEKLSNNDFVTVPALASVQLLNLQEQYNHVMGENRTFTPENIKANKSNLINFLKCLYENPAKYRSYIMYMDSAGQGLQYTYGVIREINKLVKKGVKVYVPSGHPQDGTLKWMAGKRGYKSELYYFIANGVDKNGVITNLHQEIKDKGLYDFNLLSLSDADIVGVKDASGAQDYMFAAYDSCVTDSARGVYNFSPVRYNGKLVGYSYTDTTTNQYPIEEFPANDEIANITKFVGRELYHVVANREETLALRQCIENKHSIDKCADKLYRIEDLYEEEEIKNRKLDLEGRFTDRTRTLFFDTNNCGVVTFPKCNCEGSQKPSVLSMWGSCFSTINAIARDIQSKEVVKRESSKGDEDFQSNYKNKIDGLLEKGIRTTKLANGVNKTYYREASAYFQNAIEDNKILAEKFGEQVMDYRPYYYLGLLHYDFGQLDYAEACFNNSLNIICSSILRDGLSVQDIRMGKEKYFELRESDTRYDELEKNYSSKSFFEKIFCKAPQRPEMYGSYVKYTYVYNTAVQTFPLLSSIYSKLGDICNQKDNNYAARICFAAANDLLKLDGNANEIIKRRSEKIHYIGDLYSDIREE